MQIKTVASRGLRFPVYLWLVGVYPILHLYSVNLGAVDVQEFLTTLIAMVVVTTAAFGLTNRLLRSRHETAFFLGICSIVFSLSGHVYVLVFMPKSLGVWTLTALIALIFSARMFRKIRPRKFYVQFTTVCNLIILCLILLQSISIISGHVSMSKYAELSVAYFNEHPAADTVAKVNDSPSRPDIYYIIPDGYPSDAWLYRAMNYDNSKFTEAMRDRGFVVVDHAQTSYATTVLAVASVLNMQFYDSNPSPFSDLDYLRLEIANSKVARQLITLGYTYVEFLSGSLLPSPIADVSKEFAPRGTTDVKVVSNSHSGGTAQAEPANNIRIVSLGHHSKQSFFELYIDTTLLRLARSRLEQFHWHVDDAVPYSWKSPELFLAATEEVRHIAAMPEATFTIVHLLKPHLPTVFNENGDILDRNYRPSPEEFFAEFGFVNSRLLLMISTILEKSVNPPIIIFQADHGSTYGHNKASRNRSFMWNDVESGRFTHFDVYAAYYLPYSYSIDFPERYTTINSFPLILNEIFETDYALKEYTLIEAVDGYIALFNQQDVTEEFEHK